MIWLAGLNRPSQPDVISTAPKYSPHLVRFETAQTARLDSNLQLRTYVKALQDKAAVDKYLEAVNNRQKYLAALKLQREQAMITRASRGRTAVNERRPYQTNNPPVYGNWAELINKYPWPHQTAYRIMMCESGGNANAYNSRSGATGLFQILHGPFDPAANVALAFHMWGQRGWQPWKASAHCW